MSVDGRHEESKMERGIFGKFIDAIVWLMVFLCGGSKE